MPYISQGQAKQVRYMLHIFSRNRAPPSSYYVQYIKYSIWENKWVQKLVPIPVTYLTGRRGLMLTGDGAGTSFGNMSIHIWREPWGKAKNHIILKFTREWGPHWIGNFHICSVRVNQPHKCWPTTVKWKPREILQCGSSQAAATLRNSYNPTAGTVYVSLPQ